jgi:arylsulfatase A
MLRFLSFLVFATITIEFCSPAVAAGDRPNIVLLLCDDIGAHELDVYGHPKHKTPHLDGLARTGIYFVTGYATPICHSTRFQIMTGQYGHHKPVPDVSQGKTKKRLRQQEKS